METLTLTWLIWTPIILVAISLTLSSISFTLLSIYRLALLAIPTTFIYADNIC